ncbi:MAG TPA: tail fiber domain-containing protein, partial [Candidatus Nanoarchaeia archaeon]|nr:tail fiber domain-containing protein [Candidatus Nanoarchaeia archaeon]
TTELEPFWRAASTTLSVSNFASANISQWTNDFNYLVNNGNFHGTWSGIASTSFALGSSLNSYLLKSASTSIPGYLNSNAGNWAGAWQTYNPSHFLANSASTSIPGLILSASSSQWNSFFHTPSGQISLGAGLSWTVNSIGIGSGYTLPPTTGYHNTKWDAIVTASTTLSYTTNSLAHGYIFAGNGAGIAAATSTIFLKGGYVGIGTTNPDNLIQVNGLINFDPVDYNVLLGIQAGKNLVVGAQKNTFIGYQAGAVLGSVTTDAQRNVAIGYASLYSLTSGSANMGIGTGALALNSSGNNNCSVGINANHDNTTGGGSVVIGTNAMYSNASGDNLVALGLTAGRFITDGSTPNTTTNNSVFVGANSRSLADGDTNENVFGNAATGAGSNSVVLGNDSVTKTLLKGNVGIGTTNPGTYQVYINGSGYLNDTAWHYSSDRRLKENISYFDDNNLDALDLLDQLRPASFDYINGPKNTEGFIAQDVQNVLPNLVATGTDGMLSLETTNLIPYLVRGMQQQQKQINALSFGSPSPDNAADLGQKISSALSGLGMAIANGAATLQKLIVDELQVKTARVEKLEMMDSATGEIYCAWIANGEWQKVKGDCAAAAAAEGQTAPATEPPSDQSVAAPAATSSLTISSAPESPAAPSSTDTSTSSAPTP